MSTDLYSVKMRASRKENDVEHHISGAEKIVEQDRLQAICAQLLERAIHHSKGEADFINIKVERINDEEVTICDALPVTTCEVATAEEGRKKLQELLVRSGIRNGREILRMMKETWGMRGAMLLNVDTMERMEPDQRRGVRATYMDVVDSGDDRSYKNHFREALVLATKVARHENIIGEICISDDPDYVTGYFASKKLGYVRITRLKEPGCQDGGRIFLFRGEEEEASDCIRYLEHHKMLVRIQEKQA